MLKLQLMISTILFSVLNSKSMLFEQQNGCLTVALRAAVQLNDYQSITITVELKISVISLQIARARPLYDYVFNFIYVYAIHVETAVDTYSIIIRIDKLTYVTVMKSNFLPLNTLDQDRPADSVNSILLRRLLFVYSLEFVSLLIMFI